MDNTLDKVITPKIEVILSNFTDKLTEKFTEIAGTVSSSAQTYAAVASTPTTVPAISSPVDKTWTRELKIDGISENRGDFKSQTESDIHHITAILTHLGEDSFVKVKFFKRLGKRIATSTRPRTLLVEFTSKFDCVKVLSKAYKLQSFQSPIYISKFLSPTDQIKLRKLLKLRTDVSTKDNIPKSDLKIKDLKLYHNIVEIPLPEWLADLRLCLINAQSLITSTQRLKLCNFLLSNNIDLLFVTKTGLYDEIENHEIFPASGYHVLMRLDRTSGAHGGVLIAVRVSLELSLLSSFSYSDFCCSIIIDFQKAFYSFLLIYNPPQTSLVRVDSSVLVEAMFNHRDEVVKYLGRKIAKDRVVTAVLGDINLPDVYWSSHTATSDYSNKFLTALDDLDLLQNVDLSTIVSGNILDLLCVSDPHRFIVFRGATVYLIIFLFLRMYLLQIQFHSLLQSDLSLTQKVLKS